MSMYFEEFEVGRRYPTYTRTITEADLVLFCSLVGYHNPMFIDEHYAKKTRFGGRIVPSSLTMSFSTAMTESFFRTTIVAHLSSDKATFHAPVRPGDTIGTEVEVVSKACERDNFMSPKEALDFGLIDQIVAKEAEVDPARKAVGG